MIKPTRMPWSPRQSRDAPEAPCLGMDHLVLMPDLAPDPLNPSCPSYRLFLWLPQPKRWGKGILGQFGETGWCEAGKMVEMCGQRCSCPQ